MEDGAFLGRVIHEVHRGVLTLAEAITIYERTRMPHVWTKQQASFLAGEACMADASLARIRDASAEPEVAGYLDNPVSPGCPDPGYRSWNLWGWPDSVVGVYSYDAEGDADRAVCEYLAQKGKEKMDPQTKVVPELKAMWWRWWAGEDASK